ncbi:MAG: undecaprenyldiphospho-muramoylpentapeptide beta-N-acetylglucosaminyltransferase [Prevotellaceae bacterium]|jgi:UDP-N-acetylglucosamine--N-acetylmuramyl-(pentapeptide) pyrophosphoryl-undecaprenol N-acetylglucosamine transferase|nr:undecaprenyldiphospho-muramoylpentapeptide beta-N-acetylglucosaminyltransferase [Prevotellaceae bacterium]
MSKQLKIIISGGGTGGHIYPAVSIANALQQKVENIEILFVGAEGRMEMEKVPAAGYKIVGLPVVGLQRRLTLKNLLLPFKLYKSLKLAGKIIKNFNPDVVVGVGGYASGPILRKASKMGIPTLIQEQNSYAGITNKLLAKKAAKICVAYENMEQFFPKEKIMLTGNPVRQDLNNIKALKGEALNFFELNTTKKTILVLGGSLGARTLNNTITNDFEKIEQSEYQLLWQTGKNYGETAKQLVIDKASKSIKAYDFIYRMDYAYAAADIVISRAGAGTISELCVVGKPNILVPSPNVAEDHQTKNAQALVNKNAALMVTDNDASSKLIDTAFDLINNDRKIEELSNNISKLALPDAANIIADEVLKLIK